MSTRNTRNGTTTVFAVEPKDRPRLAAAFYLVLGVLVALATDVLMSSGGITGAIGRGATVGISAIGSVGASGAAVVSGVGAAGADALNPVRQALDLTHVFEPTIAPIFWTPFALWFLAELVIVICQRTVFTSSTATIVNAWFVFFLRLAARLWLVALLWLDSAPARAHLFTEIGKVPHVVETLGFSLVVLAIIVFVIVCLLGFWAYKSPASARRALAGTLAVRDRARSVGSAASGRIKNSGVSSRASTAANQLADRRPFAALWTVFTSAFVWLFLGLDGLRGARGEELIASTVDQIDAGSHLGLFHFGGRGLDSASSPFGGSFGGRFGGRGGSAWASTAETFEVADDDMGVPAGAALAGAFSGISRRLAPILGPVLRPLARFFGALAAALHLSRRPAEAIEADPDARPEPVIILKFDPNPKKQLTYHLLRDLKTNRRDVVGRNYPKVSRRAPFYEDQVETLDIVEGLVRAIKIDVFENGNTVDLTGKMPRAPRAPKVRVDPKTGERITEPIEEEDPRESIEVFVRQIVLRPNEGAEWTIAFGGPISNDKIMRINEKQTLLHNIALNTHLTAQMIADNLVVDSRVVAEDPLFRGVKGLHFYFRHGTSRILTDETARPAAPDDDFEPPEDPMAGSVFGGAPFWGSGR